MQVKASIKSERGRSKNCRVVRRGKRLYVLDKENPRNKVRQGSK